jgi:hypothetical protein
MLELDGSTAATAIPLTPDTDMKVTRIVDSSSNISCSIPVRSVWNWKNQTASNLSRSVSVLLPPPARKPKQISRLTNSNSIVQPVLTQDTITRTFSCQSNTGDFDDFCTPQDQPVHQLNDLDLKEQLMCTRQPIKKLKTSFDMNNLAHNLPEHVHGSRALYTTSELKELDTLVNPFLSFQSTHDKVQHKRTATQAITLNEATSSRFNSEFEYIQQLGKGK